jgi:four helix bundle protein
MTKVSHFTEIIAWQKSHEYILAIYQISSNFPKSEEFGLTSQLRRAAVSITSNIAEGFDRKTSKDFAHFLVIARASLSETQNQLILAKDLGYLSASDFDSLKELSVEAHKVINGLLKYLHTN